MIQYKIPFKFPSIFEILGHIPEGTSGPISWVQFILARDIGAISFKTFEKARVQNKKSSSSVFYGHETLIFDPTKSHGTEIEKELLRFISYILKHCIYCV